MSQERILITVKTYPTLSTKYGELVCTAGIRENGSWVRLYPIPFRRLDQEDRYEKFDWIETNLLKNRSDSRPETYRPIDATNLKRIGHVGTDNRWRERRRLLLQANRVHTRLTPLLDGAKGNHLSLATFKPAEVIDFVWKPCDREWDQKKLDAMRNKATQASLYPDDEWRETFRIIPKLPYEFSYRFTDADGKKSELQILDWECGQLYWNCVQASGGDEKLALAKMKAKYMENFSKSDLHFFLGTLLQFHGFSPNPWVIIGVFPIPHERQLTFL